MMDSVLKEYLREVQRGVDQIIREFVRSMIDDLLKEHYRQQEALKNRQGDHQPLVGLCKGSVGGMLSQVVDRRVHIAPKARSNC